LDAEHCPETVKMLRRPMKHLPREKFAVIMSDVFALISVSIGASVTVKIGDGFGSVREFG
jgi:hypothetical protein